MRINCEGVDDLESDFKKSLCYAIGIRKLRHSEEPLYLIEPVSKY
jgi:hypothetical protein